MNVQTSNKLPWIPDFYITDDKPRMISDYIGVIREATVEEVELWELLKAVIKEEE